MIYLFRYIRLAKKKPYMLIKGIKGLISVNIFNKKAIRGAEIAVTYNCQGRCNKCSCRPLVVRGARELSLEQLMDLSRKIADMGAVLINLTGGEPLLRNDIIEIVRGLSAMPVLVSLATNGLLLNEAMITELKSAGLDVMQISLDSPDEIEHDNEIGIIGSYQKVLRGIEEAKAAGIEVIINTVLTKQILRSGRMEKIVKIARKNSCYLSLIFPAKTKCWGEENAALDAEDYKIAKQWLSCGFVMNDAKTSYKKNSCPAGGEKIYISPYGDIYPCPFIHTKYGNVWEDEIERVWDKMKVLNYKSCINIALNK